MENYDRINQQIQAKQDELQRANQQHTQRKCQINNAIARLRQQRNLQKEQEKKNRKLEKERKQRQQQYEILHFSYKYNALSVRKLTEKLEKLLNEINSEGEDNETKKN